MPAWLYCLHSLVSRAHASESLPPILLSHGSLQICCVQGDYGQHVCAPELSHDLCLFLSVDWAAHYPTLHRCHPELSIRQLGKW